MKARRFLNGLKPSYITQLAPLDIQTYAEMVKKAQLLEDATDLTDRIKGRLVKKEPASGSSSKPTNDKKQPFNIMGGPNQERKFKIPTTLNTDKTNQEQTTRLRQADMSPSGSDCDRLPVAFSSRRDAFLVVSECDSTYVAFWPPEQTALSRPVPDPVAFCLAPVAALTALCRLHRDFGETEDEPYTQEDGNDLE
ncbi:hypothetical protein Taro_048666 [Colocasia esculenta]|uniref:Uncharacterized protein n=1 Tax=Colocasia esculenta TaxID=4460 RepID=A0A843X8S4_COLES|nr:hypothetical protein [Colocasia esculenta]